MKNELAMAVALILAVSLWAIPKTKVYEPNPPQRSLNLTGEIMDSLCAKDGSHARMQQNGSKDARTCTLACARNSGSFVLYDPETQAVYQLDDQQKPEQFAGQKVSISGTYSEDSKTIHVQTIQTAP